MTESRATAASTSQSLARALCVGSAKSTQKEIRFANEDVPQYLKKLHEYEKQSAKVQIVVK